MPSASDYASIGRVVDQIHHDFCQVEAKRKSSEMLREMLGATFAGIQALPTGSAYKFDYLVQAGFEYKPWVHSKVCDLSRKARWDVTGVDHSSSSNIYLFDIFARLQGQGAAGELRSYFDRIGVRHALMSMCLADHGWQYVMFAGRSPGQSAFSEDERNRLRAVLPHFRCALRSRTRLLVAQGITETCRAGLDQLGVGVVAINGNGQTAFMNPAAEKIIAAADGLLDQPRFGAVSPVANRRLQGLIRAAMRDDWTGGGVAMTVPRNSGESDYELVIDAQPCPIGIPRRGGVVVYVRDRLASRETAIEAEMLQEFFGLTETEALVASSAVNGRSTQEIARHLNMQYNTVRAHFRAIYAKRGWSNRSELVQMVLGSPAALGEFGRRARVPSRHRLT